MKGKIFPNSVEVNPNPQFDASLSSEYSDMSADKASSENLVNDIVNESTNSISTQANPIFFTNFFSSIDRLSSSIFEPKQLPGFKKQLNKKGAIKRWSKLFSLHTQMYIRMKELKQVMRGQDLLNRRRKQVTRKEGKVFVCETTSVDEAYNFLQTLPSKLWQHTQQKKALFITKDPRFRLQAEETLPDYLLLCNEIGLRLGSNINSLMTDAKTIIRKLHRIDISSIDASHRLSL
ncbi:hypothetical protein Avbf_18609 [Armadillidium vulgare]|nr:hypothetical protein Avbf_18609 [Armadillidium vulgare]